ncbi:uncharacterized protein LOC116015681 [Ipomoea triloba]|uniref:uncharacterized protein LOC116015681 n=1 Tax=Ipomoea triloba TaxID=35885 RepID=UPI00125E94A9|nr:uncharacterized protein LOC116015681 [Ipomoea triloba]
MARLPVLWRSSLASAFRTALACSIVGVATLFGPVALKRQIAFPAFSYVAVILILADTTLGDALRGCWYAIYATCLGVCPAILSLWLIGPAHLTALTAAAAVGITAFIVVLPENSHVIAKRIALGQTVLVYTLAYVNGAQTEPIMHPLRVAASTTIGVGACVLALLFPYPSLACSEVKHNCHLFAENVSQRLNLLVKAFSAEDNASALSLVSQAKSLNASGAKLLQNIKSKQESMQWERYPIKFFRPYCKNPGERLQEYETPLRGMEMALVDNNPPQFPVTVISSSEVKDSLDYLTGHISKQVKGTQFDLATVPESNAENAVKFLQKLHQPVTLQDLSSFFFLFSLKLLLIKPSFSPLKDGSNDKDGSKEQEERFLNKIYSNLGGQVNNKGFVAALKYALSLGLAVFFGSIYSKPDGFWAGLTVAISHVSAREATFRIANVKVQGTVLGSIYGVLGCFVFAKYEELRFISLIPWFIVCSFLRRSRMYGPAGGISACIGAVLILGRKGFGPPSAFAMTRIMQTFLGLTCSILVELLFRPTRASSLAKIQLSKSLQLLNQCIISIDYSSNSKLEETQKILKLHVTQLGKFIGEAEVEPNFWFRPFHSACYGKLVGSLSKAVEYLYFVAQALRFLEQESATRPLWKESMDSDHLSLFRDYVGPSVKSFAEIISLVGSVSVLDKEFEKKKNSIDPELGKLPTSNNITGLSDEEIENKLKSFLEYSRQFVDEKDEDDDEDEEEDNNEVMNSQVALSLSALAFCMRGIVRETKEIDKAIKELVQWENPSIPVNLHEISCKIRALAHTVTN